MRNLRAMVALWVTALLLVAPLATAAPLASAGTVVEILVRYNDSSPAYHALKLPDEAAQLLAETLPSAWTESARTRDGAFRLQLETPVPIDVARMGANRLREIPQVLYVRLNSPDDASVGAASRAAVSSALPINRLIVKYRDAAASAAARGGGVLDQARLASLTSRLAMPVAHERAMSGDAWVVRMFRAVSADEAALLIRNVESDPDVEYAEPDLKMQAMRVPNDPLYATDQWDLATPAVAPGGANLPPAWDLTTGVAGVAVAVLDTGILPHPDLVGRYLGGYDMVSNAEVANDGDGRDPDPTDPGDWVTAAEAATPLFQGCSVSNSTWHGTHVSGTIAAASNNSAGIAGINWVGKVVPVRVLGKCFGYTSDIADAIVWASGLSVTGVPANPNPARVLNLSLGGSSSSCGATYQNAINAALGAGTVVVVAAGNSGGSAANSSPGNCSGVITVAATQAAGARASYSNYGPTVEIAAPGGGDGNPILSTLNKGTTSPDLTAAGWTYAGYQGTSMATPHVAGIASLLLAANPTLTPSQVLAKLQQTARAFPTGTVRDCTTSICGAGIVNAGAAVQAALTTTTTTTLVTSSSSAVYGTPVTLTATVTGSTPSGTVVFRDGGTSIAGCSAQPLALVGGLYKATCTTSALAVGVHGITGVYSGDAGNNGSTSSAVTVSVSGIATTTALASSAASVVYGTAVTLTATVTGASPTGTVDFRDGGASIAACSGQSVALVSGLYKATCTTSTLAVGAHSIVATYSGDAANGRSSSATVSEVVTAIATTTTLSADSASSPYGSIVAFTATVVGGTPTGLVDFRDGGQSLPGCNARPVTAVSGSFRATCKTAALALGSHSITAQYQGDVGYAPSNSAALVHVVTEPDPAQGSASSRSYISKVYVAYYGRPADAAGLAYWATRMDAAGGSLAAIIDAFANSDEFKRRYGSLDNTALVTKIYQQTLGRDPDQAGLTWYLAELTSGRRTLQSIAIDVLNGATAPPDSTVVANKLDVALYYTANELLGCPSATELELVALISAVNATSASVDAARTAIDSRCAAPH